jgi:hypothetical protein
MRVSRVLAVGRQNAILGRNSGYCGPCDRTNGMPPRSRAPLAPEEINIAGNYLMMYKNPRGRVLFGKAREAYKLLPTEMIVGTISLEGSKLGPESVVKGTDDYKYPLVFSVSFH